MNEQPSTLGTGGPGAPTAGDTTATARPLVTCHNCDRDVPPGEFCGACGAHLVTPSADGAGRHHAFAANPAEHMLHLAVVSTLFPHLPHRRSAPFRITLALAAIILLGLGLLRLTGPAIALAALAVPLLYLVYLYEVEVYEDEPALVIGATFALGLLLGIPWALYAGPIVTRALVVIATLGPTPGDVLVAGVLFPLIAQFLMIAGALVIYAVRRRRFDEVLDGFTFGAAAALGFTLSTTAINLAPDLQAGLVSHAPMVATVLSVAQRGLLIPVLNATTTGLIAGALWLRRGRVRALQAHGWSTSLPVVVLIVAVARVALGLADIYTLDLVRAVASYAALTVTLLLLARVALHHMLLAEAVEVETSPDQPCSHCYRIVPRMAFCPHCGVATRATPKAGAGRAARATRPVPGTTA